MVVQSYRRLATFPHTCIYSVEITDCESLKVIDVRDLQSLEEFRVRGCSRLRDIIGLISLDGISCLRIEDCMSLTDIDNDSSFRTANNIVSESIASATGWWNVLLMPDFHHFKRLREMCITVNAELFFRDIDTTETTLSEMSIARDSRRRSNPKCLFFPLKQSTSLGEAFWVMDGVLPRKLKCIGATIFLVLHCARASTVQFFIDPAWLIFFKYLNGTQTTLLHTEIFSNICKDDFKKAYVYHDGGAVRGGWMCVHVIEEELREDEKENVWGHFAKEIRRHVHTSLSSMTTASCYWREKPLCENLSSCNHETDLSSCNNETYSRSLMLLLFQLLLLLVGTVFVSAAFLFIEQTSSIYFFFPFLDAKLLRC